MYNSSEDVLYSYFSFQSVLIFFISLSINKSILYTYVYGAHVLLPTLLPTLKLHQIVVEFLGLIVKCLHSVSIFFQLHAYYSTVENAILAYSTTV